MPNFLPSAQANLSGNDIIQTFKGNPKVTFDDTKEFFPLSTFKSSSSTLWNAILPYRFLMLTADNNSTDPSSTVYNILSGNALGFSSVNAIYTLPISPQNISIQMPFASQTTVLSDGILVENNGIPLRQIVISGTTGVLPFRKANPPAYLGTGSNTARAAQNLASSVTNIGSSLSANTPPEFFQTGYEQFHQLSEFLQVYALLVKNPANNNVRLAFDMAKDNITYICTPKLFTLNRTADSPLEYKYTIQLEAWKRVKISGYSPETADTSFTNGVFSNLNKLQAALKTIQQVRDAVNAGLAVLGAVRADVQTLANNIRETILIAKDVAGVAKTAIDMPGQLLTDFAGPILGAVDNVVNSWQGVIATANNFKNNNKQAVNAIIGLSKQIKADASAPSSLYATQQSSSALSGLTNAGNPSPSNPGSTGGATSPTSNPASLVTSVLKNPSQYSPFLDAIKLDSLVIAKNVQDKIDAEIERVRAYTRQDFANQKEYAKEFARDLAVYCGLGDSTTDAVNGYVGVTYPASNRKPSRDELDLLFSLQQYITVLNDLSRFEISQDNSINNAFSFIGQLTQGTGINIDQTQGKIAVSVPYGATMQDIAQQYTGNADNAASIILLNGLKPPYIDETGTIQFFLSNGNTNSFNIANGNDLWIGQKVLLSSSTNPQFSRLITNVQMISNNNWLVTVDGDSNLGNLTTVQKAQIQYFARGTVSSRNSIFIPATQAPSNLPDRLKPLPYYFKDVDNLAAFTGVDIALGSNNDIIMDKHGNLALVGGIANLQQALKLKFLTPKGSLRRHPNYGFPVTPGTPTSEISFKDLHTDIQQLIGADPRFGEIQGFQLNLAGPVLMVSGGVTVNANGKVLPFALNTSP